MLDEEREVDGAQAADGDAGGVDGVDELATVRQQLDDAQTALAAERAARAAATTAYRDLVRDQFIPELGEVVTGDTIEDISAAAERARAIQEAVRGNGHGAVVVPPVVPLAKAAAPAVDTSAMSPVQKIQAAIQARGR